MKTSRRTFMKGMGITAACALGALPPGAIGARKKEFEIRGVRTVTNTTCEMCSFRCPIKAEVTGEKIFLEGNRNAPQQRNRICGRGGSGYSLVKDSKRIVEPMKRAGTRGENKWEVISWETAYKEIAEKMKAIAEKDGPESIVFSAKSGSLTNHFFNFARAFGSPNTFSHISTCPGGRYVTTDIVMGLNMGMDVENTDYLIHFGHNLYEGIEVADTNAFMKMQASGGKVISFDPRLSIASSKADEYYMIKPGTDTAVILALCNTIIQEELYDAAFMDAYVNGFEEYAKAIREITPEYAEKISGVSAADIKRIAREFMAAKPHCIASLGHRTTFSYEEFDMRRGLIALNMLAGNTDRRGGLFFAKNAQLYNYIAGEYVVPEIGNAPVVDGAPGPEADRIDTSDEMYKYMIPNGGIYQSIFTTAVSGEPYPIKGWFMLRTNPMQTIADLPMMLKTAENMELIVSCDVYMTDSAAYADYFLPDCTYLERSEDITQSPGMSPSFTVRQQVIDVIGRAKPSWRIWRELAEELGLGEYYWWNSMEERHLFQCGDDEALYKELCEKGSLSYGLPLLFREPEVLKKFVEQYPESEYYLDSEGMFSEFVAFGTESGKVELCPDELNYIAPDYYYPRFQNIPLRESEDEYFFIQGKVAVHTNGGTAFVPNLSYYMPENPIWIHPETAAKLGVKTGDFVELENSVGKEKGRVLVTEGIRTDTVFTYMAGSGVKKGDKRTAAAKNGVNCANLLKMSVNDITAMVVHNTGVRLAKARE
jgi:thiosulfate reductase/polysulfide reductase chain A